MQFKLKRNLRRTSIIMNLLGTISIIMSLVGAFFPQGAVQAGSGAIWTTRIDCGNEPQDENHFSTWDIIYLHGSGFDVGVEISWWIKGKPGGASSDPGITVASGLVTPVAPDGTFCFEAYTVLPGDEGEYQVKVGNKGDNYRVDNIEPGSISVDKVADPTSVPESGGNVDFTVTVNNTDAAISFTLDSLLDNVFGDLNGLGTCSVPQTIVPLGSYSCTFTAGLSGDVGVPHIDVVTGSGTDENTYPLSDFDDATVTFTDVLPLIEVVKSAAPTSVNEPGGAVTFSITVSNLVDEELTLNSLSDTVFGDLNGQGSCLVPQTLAPTIGTYTCSFSAIVNGQPGDTHVDVVTANASDNEGNPAEDDDDAAVTFDDVLPVITIVKTADPTVVPEPYSPATYSLTITNLSAEAVTLTSLEDDIYGDVTLIPGTTCVLPQPLAASGDAGDSYSCSFDAVVDALFGETITDVVTASAVDDDGSIAEASDDASVTVMDAVPSIGIEKTADPTTLPESGGNVNFTVTVTNTGPTLIFITSLVDDRFGDLIFGGAQPCLDAFLTFLAPLEQYFCTFPMPLSGSAGSSHTNVVTVTGQEEGSNPSQVSDFDDATVTFTDVLPDISVEKTADPTTVVETGEDVTFTVVVTNNATIPVSLTTLVDDKFGDLHGDGDCSVPQTLAASGGFYSCSFTVNLSGEAGAPHTNTVTATAWDNGNSATDSDDATVNFTDVLPDITVVKTADPTSVPETGGNVDFLVHVTNWSDEAVTLDSLIDDKFGDLDGQGTCSLTQPLAPNGEIGAVYDCTFTEFLSGDADTSHTDIVTASASDNEGNTDVENDDAVVGFTDVLPVIDVDKFASPLLVPETGAEVTYDVYVTNLSLEAVELHSLVDSIYGDLDGQGTCEVPQTLAPSGEIGDFYYCYFTQWVSGPGGSDEIDVITAQALDNEGNLAQDDDDAIVSIQDIVPNLSVEKTAAPGVVPESGDDVTFTVTVTNIGSVKLWLTGLVDSFFGDLNGKGSCNLTPYPELDPGAQYSCSFIEFLAGDESTLHENTVTARGEDADDNEVTDEDNATVEFYDILPLISVVKRPSTGVVYAPGGNVTFNVTITNLSAEAVNITSLVDSVFGNLNGAGTCAVPQALAPNGDPGDSYSCSFTGYVSGAPGATHTNIATANGFDDDQNPVSDDGLARVRVLSLVTPPPFIPVTGVDLGSSELPLGSLGFASLGLLFFGLAFVTKGYADTREEDEE